MATKRIGNMRNAHYFHGANAGAKIVAAVADLPSGGGVVDCRGFEGGGVITQNIFAGLPLDRPVTFLFNPASQFGITATQTIAQGQNIKILGTSGYGVTSVLTSQATQFIWNGSNGGTVLLLDRTRDSSFEGFSIVPGTGTIGIGIRIDHTTTPSGTHTSENNQLRGITIYTSTTGIQIGNTSVANNSEHVFEDVHIVGVGTHGYWINNGQSKRMKIVRGHITDRTYGVYQNAGSFCAIDTNLNSNTNDFSLNSATDTIQILNCESENAARFLTGQAATLSPWPVVLMGNSYVPNALHADGCFIFFGNAGNLTLIGNDFSGGSYNSNAKLWVQGTNPGAGRVASIGNTYPNDQIFVANPNVGNADIVSLQDNAWESGSGVVQLPNILGSAYNGVLSLSNGANSNIPTSGGSFNFRTSRQYRITGPTGAFSISGFTGGVAGRELQLFNTTSQQMTITNLATSSSSNQIQTLTGADVVLRSGTSYASFVYDIVLAKWILISTN